MRQPDTRQLEALLLEANSKSKGPMQQLQEAVDGGKTDPEPDMDSGRATVRNVRSKCRCSCVLQFTLQHAVSCALHRPSSQVIHCIEFCIAFRDKALLSKQKLTVQHGTSRCVGTKTRAGQVKTLSSSTLHRKSRATGHLRTP